MLGLDLDKSGNLGASHSGISTNDGSIVQLEVNNIGMQAGYTIIIFLVTRCLLSITCGACKVCE